MSAIPQTDRWIEFFKLYRQLPALWSVFDEVYKNQRMKKKAFECLLECFKTIDPKANVDSMRRKINSIRTCYRRELRKVEQSELLAKKKSEIYVPHLWYFNELSFLRGNDSRPQLASTTESSDRFWNEDDRDDEESLNGFASEDKDNYSEKETKVFEQCLPILRNESPVNGISLGHQVETAQIPPQSQVETQTPLNPSRDEADIYAEGWATSYRKLDATNRLLAKKAIEEILVLGQLDKLEFNSVKMPN